MKLGFVKSAIGNDQPFLNIMHAADVPATRNAGANTNEESILLLNSDANQYPTTLAGSPSHTYTSVRWAVLTPNTNTSSYGNRYRTGRYVFLYDGTGTFSFYGDLSQNGSETGQGGGAGTGRFLIDVSSTNTTCYIELTSTGATYAKNFRFVYAPTATSSVIDPNETQVTAAEAGDYSKAFSADFLARYNVGFDTVRMQRWFDYATPTMDSTWASRTPAGALRWWSGDQGYPIIGMMVSVPLEIQVAFCNKINANAWFTIPLMVNDDYVTQMATYVYNNLNSSLKVYVELSNEAWQGANNYGHVWMGSFTGFIDNGAGGGSYTGVAGNTLTVTASNSYILVGTNTLASTTNSFNAHFLSDVNPSQAPWYTTSAPGYNTYPIAQVSGTPHYAGVYTVNGPAQAVPSKTINLFSNQWDYCWMLGQMAYPSSPNVQFGTAYQYIIKRMVEVGNNFRSTFNSLGGSSAAARVVRMAGWQSQTGTPGHANDVLNSVPSGPPSGSWGGSATTYWASGTVASNIDETYGASYWPLSSIWPIPYAWSAENPNFNSMFTEIMSGGLMPTSAQAAGAKTTTGGSTNYVLNTSGDGWTNGGVAATPANGKVIIFKAGANNSASSETLTVDGGNTFGMVDVRGNALVAGTIVSGTIYSACFTNAVMNPASPPNSMAISPAKWYVMQANAGTSDWTNHGIALTSGGMIYASTLNTSNSVYEDVQYILGLSIRAHNIYEGGQNFDDYSLGVYDGYLIDIFYTTINNHATMESAYAQWLSELNSITGLSVVCHYNDVTQNGVYGYWGAMENILDPATVPKYDALVDFLGTSATINLMGQACL